MAENDTPWGNTPEPPPLSDEEKKAKKAEEKKARANKGPDDKAPYGYTPAGNIRRRPLKGIKPAPRGPHGKTNTGRVKNVPVNMDNWRTKLQASRIKFDDVQKQIYLDDLATHGLKGGAASTAGVHMATVQAHRENDPDFAEGEVKAMEDYRKKIVSHHQNLCFEGEVTKRYDKEGNLIAKEHKFPTQLILAELAKVDPAYRRGGGASIDIDIDTQGGGVLVAPAEVSPHQWVEMMHNATANKPHPKDVREAETQGPVIEHDSDG